MRDSGQLTSPSRAAIRVSTVLVWGFRISAVLIAAGLVRALVAGQALDAHLPPTDDLLAGLRTARTDALLALGVIAMLLTPVAASVGLAVSFLQERDRRYGALATLVILILGASLALALR